MQTLSHQVWCFTEPWGSSPFGISIPSEIDADHDKSKKLMLKDSFGSMKCEIAFQYLRMPGFLHFNLETIEQSQAGPTIGTIPIRRKTQSYTAMAL
jgi:hypothetical protein